MHSLFKDPTKQCTSKTQALQHSQHLQNCNASLPPQSNIKLDPSELSDLSELTLSTNINHLVPHSDPLPELPKITDPPADATEQITTPLLSHSENTPLAPVFHSLSTSTASSSPDKSSIKIHTVVPWKCPVKMSNNKEAVASHLALLCPPHLSKGKITLNNVWEFENHCKNHSMNAKGGVEDGQKVMKILGCFENLLVNNWISVNWTCLWTLTVEEFMIEFQQHWIPRNWEEDVAMHILSSHLNP